MDRKLHYIDKNRIKEKNNNEADNLNIKNENSNNQIVDSNIENVIDKMKSNINNLKLHKQIKEKTSQNNINNINIKSNIINNNDNIIINSINIENNIINNNQKILYINNKNDISKKQLENIILDNKEKDINNQENESMKKEKSSNNTIKNNEINVDENLNINQSIKSHQDKSNDINKKNNKINILQNLKGISSNQNKGYESTLMSNVSYSSFLSFKNKKVKFVNLNTSINQSLLNNKSKQDEIKKLEEEDKEIINKKEQENMMENILKRFGGTDIIKEKEDEQEDKNFKLNIEDNKNKNININNKIKENEQSECLLFNISKQYQIKSSQKNLEENYKNKSNNSIDTEKEKNIKVNSIKCTLSFLDKGKAIFVSENDDIFWLPSATLNEKIKVGNSYLFQIDKLNNQLKRMNEIENIQKKYRVWK